MFAGKKDDLGNTVVIQHADQSESWYGHLEAIDVKQYEKVEKGEPSGRYRQQKMRHRGNFISPSRWGRNSSIRSR
ncbi:peptidoglycan DD-metalloendopeptidase family protein [Rossellomorea sp. H39__3]